MRPRRETLEEVANDRPKRTPVSESRDVLAARNIPEDKVARWVNDVSDRIIRFREGGWEFITDTGVCVGEKTVEASRDCGSTIRRLVGTGPNNEPLYAYLMAISKDWYNEDQERKQDRVDELEESIYERAQDYRRAVKSDSMYGSFKTHFGDD